MTETPALPWCERAFRSQDGLSLFYRDTGERAHLAPALLCLSGLTRNSRDFEALSLRVSEGGRRVVSLDYRGRGRSEYDPDWKRYNPRTYVDDVRHLIAAAQLHRVIVVGTSLGGLLAMAMGAAMPTVLAGVVLNDVGPDIDQDGLGPIYAYLGEAGPVPDWPAAAQRLRTHFGHWHDTDEVGWLDLARASYRETPEGQVVPDWDLNLARAVLAARDAAPVDLWPLYRSLRQVPVLVVRGATSTILRADTVSRMIDGMPHATAVTVPDVGHAPTLSEPAAAAAIDAFLAST